MSFNHPYQFGWLGKDHEDEAKSSSSFKNSSDLCTSSIHIRRGDIVVLATDGLFDNVDVDEISAIALEWEKANGFIGEGGIKGRERRWRSGRPVDYVDGQSPTDLAKRLVRFARDRSLREDIDSPFAILAKENDIMWSGGMPDDCSVIVFHVVGDKSLSMRG